MIAGHETVTAGDILLENRNITRLGAAERGTAMMFQSFALFPHLSALDNVAFSLKMKGVAKAERHKRAHELLEPHGIRCPAFPEYVGALVNFVAEHPAL